MKSNKKRSETDLRFGHISGAYSPCSLYMMVVPNAFEPPGRAALIRPQINLLHFNSFYLKLGAPEAAPVNSSGKNLSPIPPGYN